MTLKLFEINHLRIMVIMVLMLMVVRLFGRFVEFV